MSFWKSILNFWTRIFDYKGRSTRKEFWIGILQILLIPIIATIIGVAIFGFDIYEDKYLPLIATCSIILLILPYISLIIRRMRDIGFTNLGIIFIILIAILANAAFNVVIFIIALLPTNAFILNNSSLINKILRKE